MISQTKAQEIQGRYLALTAKYGDALAARAILAEQEGVSEETVRDYLSFARRNGGIPEITLPDALRSTLFDFEMRPGEISLGIIKEKREKVYLVPLEAHVGAAEFNEAIFNEWIEWVKNNPDARLLFPGDLLECATRTSIGNPFTQKMSPEEQMERAVEYLAPVSDKIYGMCQGNHEDRITNNSGIHPIRWVAKALNVPYFDGNQGVLRVYINSITYLLYFVHGSSSAGTNGGRILAAERMGRIITDADCYIYGHTHGSAATKQERLVVTDRVKTQKYYTVLAGSFLGYAEYAKRKGKQPLPEGAPRIRLDGNKKDLHVEI